MTAHRASWPDRTLSLGLLAACWLVAPVSVSAQTEPPSQTRTESPVQPSEADDPSLLLPPLPPATKLEAFQPAAGSLLVLGYDELGTVRGISVDVREMRDTRGGSARGLVVQATESQKRREQAFIDADELPELLKAFDALLDVRANPTPFRNFEVRYTTRGELELSAYNAGDEVVFSVTVGRAFKWVKGGLSVAEMQRLRGIFDVALQKLNALGPVKTASPVGGQ